MKVLFLSVLVLCSFFEKGNAQTQTAKSLRSNVVTILAQNQNGFGFITGNRNNKLFIVTASHVVNDLLRKNKKVVVQFFNSNRRFNGKVIRNFPEKDIALLRVKKPNNIDWAPYCLSTPKINDKVGFVGRNREWYVPTGKSLGVIRRIENNLIQFDISSVVIGTSGAPLINSEGIIGMIVKTDGITATAIHLNEILKKLSENSHFFILSKTKKIKDEF